MNLLTIPIQKPEATNVIIGQTHFIKSVEDLYEAIVQTNPALRFGLAFCEASGPSLVRWAGNDPGLINMASSNALKLSCGHCFLIFLENGFPISILNAVKNVPEVCHIYCATANPVDVIVAETEQGRGIMGVVDGFKSKGVETEKDIATRKDLLRKIGYKL